MRKTAYVLFGVLWVVACRSAPPPTPEPISNSVAPPVEVKIALEEPMREKLALGLPMALEMRVAKASVGSCTVARDLWNEVYRVQVSRVEVEFHREANDALKSCVDVRKLQTAAGGQRAPQIVVTEAPPRDTLYKPPAYPVF